MPVTLAVTRIRDKGCKFEASQTPYPLSKTVSNKPATSLTLLKPFEVIRNVLLSLLYLNFKRQIIRLRS